MRVWEKGYCLWVSEGKGGERSVLLYLTSAGSMARAEAVC